MFNCFILCVCVCAWTTPSTAQGLPLVLCAGITPEGTICRASYRTQANCIQGEHSRLLWPPKQISLLFLFLSFHCITAILLLMDLLEQEPVMSPWWDLLFYLTFFFLVIPSSGIKPRSTAFKPSALPSLVTYLLSVTALGDRINLFTRFWGDFPKYSSKKVKRTN